MIDKTTSSDLGPNVQSTTIAVEPKPTLPSELRSLIGDARRALWEVERELWHPRVLVAKDVSGAAVGAVLTTGRPYCSYRKIVDVVATQEKTWCELVVAARDDTLPWDASSPHPVVVHFEEHLEIAPLSSERKESLTREGFIQAPPPAPSIRSTHDGDLSSVSAWSWWRNEKPRHIAPYYGQTTEVTCGAASSLMALELRGQPVFSPVNLSTNRGREIAFWRRANNLPACEPVGLAVELAESRVASGALESLPKVFLSTREHVLLEDYADSEAESSLRVDLQNESRRQAVERGIEVDYRWMEVSEIIEHLRHGAQLLLLIDLTPLIGDPTPHWILATDCVQDTVIVSDPWVNDTTGETWVDTFSLPITREGIDLITRWGAPPYRGVIVLPSIHRTP